MARAKIVEGFECKNCGELYVPPVEHILCQKCGTKLVNGMGSRGYLLTQHAKIIPIRVTHKWFTDIYERID